MSSIEIKIATDQLDLAQDLLDALRENNRKLVEPFAWLPIKQAAARLHVCESTIRKWMDEGWLPFVKIGKVVNFRSDKLDAAFELKGEIKATHPDLLFRSRTAPPKRRLA